MQCAHHRNISGWLLVHMAAVVYYVIRLICKLWIGVSKNAETILHFGDVHTSTAQEFPMHNPWMYYICLMIPFYMAGTTSRREAIGNLQLAGSSDREMVPQHCVGPVLFLLIHMSPALDIILRRPPPSAYRSNYCRWKRIHSKIEMLSSHTKKPNPKNMRC